MMVNILRGFNSSIENVTLAFPWVSSVNESILAASRQYGLWEIGRLQIVVGYFVLKINFLPIPFSRKVGYCIRWNPCLSKLFWNKKRYQTKRSTTGSLPDDLGLISK